LASGGEDCRVNVWDTHTMLWLAELAGLPDSTRSLAWHRTPRGLHLVMACSSDPIVRYWEVSQGEDDDEEEQAEEEGQPVQRHWRITLRWASDQTMLYAHGANLNGVVGLHREQRQLLTMGTVGTV